MTDGTSQGLFIVVAIVIFGIFTLMAYILFEDTLSPALANMFTEATEQASTSLNSNYTKLDLDLFVSRTDYLGYISYDFERIRKDTGDTVPQYNGRSGVLSEDKTHYKIVKDEVINGYDTSITKLDRVYIQHPIDVSKTFHFVRRTVTINGKLHNLQEITQHALFEGEDMMRYAFLLEDFILEIDKPYTFVIRLYTEDMEYFEFEKTIILVY